MKCKAGLVAVALWHALGAQNITLAEEVRKQLSLSFQNGLYIGAEYLRESLTQNEKSPERTAWTTGQLGWNGSFSGFTSNFGLSYENPRNWGDGVINVHTQLTRSMIATGDHDLGLSMRLNVAMPFSNITAVSTSASISFHDLWKPSESLTIRQAFVVASYGEEIHRGAYEFGLDWQLRKNITLEVPLTIGVPLGESEGEPDVAVFGRFKMRF